MATYYGTEDGDYVYGFYDVMFGNGGRDYLSGGATNDSLYGGAGDDTLLGNDGNDLLDDYSAGSFGGDDSMDGGAGNDTIYGYDGNDTLNGGDGSDALFGETGNDILNGGLGADTMDGGEGGDTYYVDNVGDRVIETSNESYYDTVYSGISFTLGDNVERLYLTGRNGLSGVGNELANNITGNGGNNLLSGFGGNDSLYGGDGNDSLVGGDGDDMLAGESGSDVLSGGAGNDSYRVNTGDTVIENAGSGSDTVYASSNWTVSSNIESTILDGNVTVYGNSDANNISAGWYSGVLYGLSGDDTLSANYNATLSGGTGNDHYEVSGRNEIIVESAGQGVDSVSINFEYEQTYVVGENVENISVRDGMYGYWYSYYYSSHVVANAASNWIDGGNGDNEIRGMNGADTIYGNDGNDVLDGGGGTDYLDGGVGTDTVLYTSNTTPVRVDLTNGVVTFPGQNYPAETVVSIENAQGGSGNDILIGNFDGNVLTGNNGNDMLAGRIGNDELYGGAGNDTLDGGDGTDYLSGGAGTDTIIFTANTTSVNVNLTTQSVSFPGQNWPGESLESIENATTGWGNDTLAGSSGANELHGMDGADRLVGAGGADRLVGGAGNDVFVFTANSSAPGARDTILAGDGATAFQGAGAAAGDRFDVSGFDADITKGGIQDWIFGTAKTKGHLWMTTSGTQTILNGNNDNDAAIEFQVAIADAGVAASAYKIQDFIL
ncbi:Ca2+-binding RTX toxin-like protein [Amaricoccus macauensis]|uniref:Ca2+-binding RTX toxin-like protein n=1 Tax=Amaricoccus macauensis TaxID=57001 RepID=A0A840SRC9_9RHOB|nr:calcium-binding protein [Amaricoccus macauensis]MBB5223125.1 Ca2+-binding RTX toxin-like protein [Amaricoccus macauensis]